MRCLSAPLWTIFCGGQIKTNMFFLVKIVMFLWGYIIVPMTLFRHIWMTNRCQIQNQRTKLPLGHKNPKNDIWRQQRSLISADLGWPRKGHNVSVNHGWNLGTLSMSISPSKNVEVRMFQALKWYGTQISLVMTLEIRSQVKGHNRDGLKIFR